MHLSLALAVNFVAWLSLLTASKLVEVVLVYLVGEVCVRGLTLYTWETQRNHLLQRITLLIVEEIARHTIIIDYELTRQIQSLGLHACRLANVHLFPTRFKGWLGDDYLSEQHFFVGGERKGFGAGGINLVVPIPVTPHRTVVALDRDRWSCRNFDLRICRNLSKQSLYFFGDWFLDITCLFLEVAICHPIILWVLVRVVLLDWWARLVSHGAPAQELTIIILGLLNAVGAGDLILNPYLLRHVWLISDSFTSNQFVFCWLGTESCQGWFSLLLLLQSFYKFLPGNSFVKSVEILLNKALLPLLLLNILLLYKPLKHINRHLWLHLLELAYIAPVLSEVHLLDSFLLMVLQGPLEILVSKISANHLLLEVSDCLHIL